MTVLRFAFGLAVAALALPAVAGAQSAAGSLTLPEALARARAQSPAIAAARARVDAARDAAARAGRLPNPFVELRSENWASNAPDGTLPLDVFATVTQTLELGGKRGARRAQAHAGLASATSGETLVWREVALAVAGDYLQALRAREHARVRSEFAAQMAEAARVMGRRVEVGTAPEADLLKLRTEDARALLERTRAELDAARAATALGARLGLTVSPAMLQVPGRPPVPETPEGVPASHPALLAAAAAVEAARATVGVERARAVPDVGVNAGYKRTAGFNSGVAAVTIPIPLFDRNGVARALAEGQLRMAEFERDATRQRLEGTLQAARHAAATLAARAADLQATLVSPAAGNRDAARAAFAAGALDVLRLVDAERLYLDAVLASIDIDIDAVVAAIEARLAAGEDPLP